MKRFWKGIGFLLLLFFTALITSVYVVFGGRGLEFPDRSGKPVLLSSAMETVATLDEPPGNVAVSASGRIFFTIHPESRPETNQVMEWVDGKPAPYPDAIRQALFTTPLGLIVDSKDRLWVLDHGMHGLRVPRLLAFDLKNNELLIRYDFPRDVAGLGSMLNDLQADPEAKRIYIADTGLFSRKPAVVIYDVENNRARRVLEKHPSTIEQRWVIRNPDREMIFLGGLFALRPAIDSITLDRRGEWLYYGPMSHDTLFRVRTADLNNTKLSATEIYNRVESYAPKPQSDGLSIDGNDNIYITDVEHRAILMLSPDRKLSTLIKDVRLRWPDGLSFGPEDWLYLADSDIPDLILHDKDHIRSQAPYYLFRFRSGHPGVPGQ